MAMHASERPFKQFWASDIYPLVKDDFERLQKSTPTRIAQKQTKHEEKEKEKEKEKAEKEKAKAAGSKKEKAEKEKEKEKAEKEEKDFVREKLQQTIEDVRAKRERRNVHMNLAWTGPIDNSYLGEKITLGKVENMAADMFLDCPATDGGGAETARDPGDGAGDAEPLPQKNAERRAVETLSAQAQRPWHIPPMVEKGFEIPIMIAKLFPEPELGKFKRLGMDVVVNAVWLAYYWAKKEGSTEAATALEELILDWPFDFIGIEGDTTEEIEENKFKWAVNMSARVERLRDFVGLENANLLRIVARAADIVQAATAGGRKPTPEKVQEWLRQNVKWGLQHCPDTKTVKRHMDNWAAIQKCPAALELIEAAVNRWGRDNLLDWPTKLGIIVQKSDATSLAYVVESLYTRMWRMGEKDPYTSRTIEDGVAEILWAKSYIAALMKKYPEVWNASCNSATSTTVVSATKSIKTAKSYLESPLKFFLQTEGPDKDPTWLQALPNEALRIGMKHCLEIGQGFYKQEITGALKQPKAERFDLAQFHKGTRVMKRFFEPFQIAYDSLVGKPLQSSEDAKAAEAATAAATANADAATAEAAAPEEKTKKSEVTQVHISAFRAQCEAACQKEIDGRVVIIFAEGTAVEIHASLTKTRLYQNLTEAATVMGFYDIKNARLCSIFEGQGLTHREPALDEEDFERYVKSIFPLMVAARDVLWVLVGRTDTNRSKVKKSSGGTASRRSNSTFATTQN